MKPTTNDFILNLYATLLCILCYLQKIPNMDD